MEPAKDVETALLIPIAKNVEEDNDSSKVTSKNPTDGTHVTPNSSLTTIDGKKILALVLVALFGFLLYDAFIREPEDRLLKPDTANDFLQWVETNPYWGIGAFLVVIAICVVFMIPVGTPLTLGCGYIYKHLYGWGLGVAVATAVSMAGSGLGAVACFLLGRYMMRDFARQWVKKYPLFDAIDMAIAEHGLRIMAMLYLTPILPLGPVSYMCGSTSMTLSSFVIAKIASLPLMMLYVFMGASAGTLITNPEAIENNSFLIFSGIALSAIMIACVSYYVRKELMTILDRQKNYSKKDDVDTVDTGRDDDNLDLGLQSQINQARQRRHAAHSTMDDIPIDNDDVPEKDK